MSKQLTAEERRAKFAAKPEKLGLISKGFRKITVKEQEKLLKNLPRHGTPARLEELRVLREAAKSERPSKSTELEIYELSAKELILQNQLAPLAPVLSRLNELTPLSTYSWLYTILLSNTHQFNLALQLCRDDKEFNYVRSVVTKDVPVYTQILLEEKNDLAQKLMKHAKLEEYKASIQWTLVHPSKRTTKTNNSSQK